MVGKNTSDKRDWRISAVLATVWATALAVVLARGVEIPASMLLLATVFFVLLIPAMNDLVRNIEKASSRAADKSANDPEPGGRRD